MKTRLYIVRHAETEGNANRLCHGWTDAKLTEKGYIQAQRLADRFKDIDIDVIYSSSLIRTKETARHIAEVKDLPINITDNLKEINAGYWEDKKWEDIPGIWPYEYHTWENIPHIHSMPGGETMEEFQQRLISEVELIIRNNKGKNICIVSHGTAIKALTCYFRGCTLEEMVNNIWVDNTSITIVDYVDGEYNVSIEGDNSHLGDKLGTIKFQKWWEDNEERLEMKNRLITALFETKALQVCPEDSPFWYTSGTIGPYYINTHFLYGSEEKANLLLEKINNTKFDRLKCSTEVLAEVSKNYKEEPLYRELIDGLCNFVKNKVDIDKVQYISGGERRDWFFSLIAAKILNKPHLTIFKDLDVVLFNGVESHRVDNIEGGKVLHIADLITEASSYIRTWIPAVKKINGDINWSIVVVDRKQGGGECLAREKIIAHAMVYIDKSLFDKALSLDFINNKQYKMIIDYINNPRESMKHFLKEYPQFLQKALNGDQRTRERAELCLKNDIYGLGEVIK
jgi:broad specificity phosphatase PhoE/orotate phosphoribosyltransferase